LAFSKAFLPTEVTLRHEHLLIDRSLWLAPAKKKTEDWLYQKFQVIAKREHLFSLFSSQRRCCDGSFFQTALHLCNLSQSAVPTFLQLSRYKAIFRLGGLILPLDAASLIACLLNRKFKRAPFSVGLVLTRPFPPWGLVAKTIPFGLSIRVSKRLTLAQSREVSYFACLAV
jgi:hypothetical protein